MKRALKYSAIGMSLALAIAAAIPRLRHGLFFALLRLPPFPPEIEELARSPDGRYRCYLVNSSFQGFHYEVYLTRWYYLLPKRVLHIEGEDVPVAFGHLVWSKDCRYVALNSGQYYVDAFDFKKGQRIGLGMMLGLGEFDRDKLLAYHGRVQEIIEGE